VSSHPGTSSGLVLVIGADREPSASLVGDLRRLGYRPGVTTWPVAQLRLPGPRPLAVLVDLRVSALDAGRACRAVRAEPALRFIPLVAVVAEHEAPRLDLSLGFDDLLLAPYRITELSARLRLLRWRQERESPAEAIRAGDLVLNPLTYQVAIEGTTVDLTLKEYQLLLFLLRNSDRVFTRGELLDRVWGSEYYGGTRTVDVHIRRLREKTAAAGDLIETVRGVGYRLVIPA